MAAVLLTACDVADDNEPARYAHWLDDAHRQTVDHYRIFLTTQGVGDVAPMHALLGSSRRWHVCHHDEFVIPPRALWPHIVPTLRVVSRLQRAGLLNADQIRSSYRDPIANNCAGGSSESRHLSAQALDLDVRDAPENVARLCAFWRAYGAELALGLGFYTSTRIHIDTAGFRTWGNDYHYGSSLCVTPKPTP